MKNDLISVIVPIYNVERYLNKCVDSIINQTYQNLEIILVDDGSPDNCPIICDEYAKKDKRIKVIHKENGGLSDARNVGINIAKGKYLSFIDSDDYIDSQMLEKLYNNLNETKSELSFCNFYRVFPDKKYLQLTGEQSRTFQEKEIYYTLVNQFAKVIMSACNKLYKREIFNDIKYPTGMIMEDSYIILDILLKTKKISYLNEPLYYYFQRDNSIMHNFNLKNLDIMKVYERRMEFCLKNNDKDLLILVKKTYIYNLILKIIPGLISINNNDKLKKVVEKVKTLSKEIRSSNLLTLKEKIKFYILSYCPITYVKIRKIVKGDKK